MNGHVPVRYTQVQQKLDRFHFDCLVKTVKNIKISHRQTFALYSICGSKSL